MGEAEVLREAVRWGVESVAYHLGVGDVETARVMAGVVRSLLAHPDVTQLRLDLGWARIVQKFKRLSADLPPPPLDGLETVRHFAAVALAEARRDIAARAWSA
jgi:hypothetical protein